MPPQAAQLHLLSVDSRADSSIETPGPTLLASVLATSPDCQSRTVLPGHSLTQRTELLYRISRLLSWSASALHRSRNCLGPPEIVPIIRKNRSGVVVVPR